MKALVFVLLFYPSDRTSTIEIAAYGSLGDCLEIADSLIAEMPGHVAFYCEKRE